MVELPTPSRAMLEELRRLPFDEALRQLKETQGWSLRQLSERTKADGRRGLSQTYLHLLCVGRERPARPEVIETIAAACGVPVEVFAEYRVLRFLARFEADYEQRYLEVVRLDPSVDTPGPLAA